MMKTPEQLKGAILGVAERTTMDMDTTVKGLPMDEQSIRKAISEILDLSVDDGIEFQLLDLTPIREDDKYENFRASIQATYGKMKIPMKIDITTGDEITPKEIQFSYPFLFDDRRVMVKAYTTGNHTGGKIRNDHPKKCRKYAGKRFL